MLNADILRLLSAIRYDFFILPLFNNRQASLNNLTNFRPFESCIGRNLHYTLAICTHIHRSPLTDFKEIRGRNAFFKVYHFVRNIRVLQYIKMMMLPLGHHTLGIECKGVLSTGVNRMLVGNRVGVDLNPEYH